MNEMLCCQYVQHEHIVKDNRVCVWASLTPTQYRYGVSLRSRFSLLSSLSISPNICTTSWSWKMGWRTEFEGHSWRAQLEGTVGK